MGRVRVIPVLLIKNGGLYKGVKFKNHKYIGDPINAVKIFNEKEVDELMLLDISATPGSKEPDYRLISNISGEAFMPIGYGGGLNSINQVKRVLYDGVEKVVLNSNVFGNYKLIEDIASSSGSQSIVVSIDIKKNLFGKAEVYSHCGTVNTHKDPLEYAKELENAGVGELIIQSVDKDGTYSGYDLKLLKKISESVNIPIIASCGAAGIEDFQKAVIEGGASAVAAGSLFVFFSNAKGVLINYPSQEELKKNLSV
ncbi:MAG: AglZ/HisF2 family acetamidino modification protein [Cytophagaceae bacterium]